MQGTSRLLVILVAIATSQAVLSAQSDTTPPALTSLSFSASSVDVSAAPATLTVSASITDDLSGVNNAVVVFTSPSGQTVRTGLAGPLTGNRLNGTYRATVSFPLFLEAGTWTVMLQLLDNAGNSSILQSPTLITLGFPGTLTVIDSTPDTTPPTLLGASFSPSTINTSTVAQDVTVNLHISDSQTGADFTHQTTFAVTLSPEGAGTSGPFQYLSTADFKLSSGTAQDGVWQATKTMPRFSGGNWVITQMILYDSVTNRIILTPAQLAAMGVNPVLIDSSAPEDLVPPTLTGFNFSPSVVDTSASSQNVTVTVSASDDISGVDFTPTTTTIAWIEVGFTSPSGNQNVFINPFIAPTPVAGTSLAGTWQLTAPWPQFSEEGTWNASFFRLQDKVGNFRSFTPAQLKASGFPSTIVITKPSLATDGTIGPGGGTVDDDAFGSRASITFPPGLISSPTKVSIDVFSSVLSVPTPRGFTMPGTYFENLSFVPALPEPVPAPGITVVLPLLTPMTPGAHLSLYHIDPVIGLAPAMNASGHPVVGTVGGDGVSAIFTNVVTFSTVVAYLSTGSALGDVNGDGSVNCADVSIVKGSFGKHTGQAGFNSAADLNNDGTINILDLFIVSRQLSAGTSCQ